MNNAIFTNKDLIAMFEHVLTCLTFFHTLTVYPAQVMSSLYYLSGLNVYWDNSPCTPPKQVAGFYIRSNNVNELSQI